eukprot:TRINITY_DN45079_c1_g1_i1.p1 TRINITY_DN45079_c1_g1~~TRINITY_DN45079_c1_g1_i1.p1  ORF type:complete len:522 (+),score=72.01 TRINITY_DN45079_c1_g1_i1:97-1566(+)
MARIVSRVRVGPETQTAPPAGSWGEKYRTGPWRPNTEEIVAEDLEVIQGSIPTDISGYYLRNTENPVYETMDGNNNYHPFDGDGMLHMLRIKDGKASYRNRWVRTTAFEAERKAGRSLWAGLLEAQKSGVSSEHPGWGDNIGKMLKLKDTASTDVVVHAGRIVPSWYLCGEAYTMNLQTLETEGIATWSPKEGMSAHCKVDETSGELLFFNYGWGKGGPFFHYGEVSPQGQLQNYQRIPWKTRKFAGMPHDMAFSRRHSILNYFCKDKTYFAIIPRGGSAAQVSWFEGSATYVLHWLNAYEEGDELVLDGYHMNRADIFMKLDCLDLPLVEPRLWRWRFNLKTGATSEQCLDSTQTLEFGMFNQKYQGVDYRYAYSVIPESGKFLFTGITKSDLKTGNSWTYNFGADIFGSEAPVVPKIGGKDEDDAYLVSFLIDMARDRSVAVLIDAKNVEAGPVCTILLPHRICSGTHSFWADDASVAVVKPPLSKL